MSYDDAGTLRAVATARRALADGTARRIREAALVEQSDIARALHVSVASVNAWERGYRSPRPEVAARLAGLLDMLADVSGPRA